MKILHIITSLWTGGAEKLVSEIVPILRDDGHDVDVCSFVGQETYFKKTLENAGIKVISFTNSRNIYNPFYVFRLIPLMRGYDIVHTHNVTPLIFAAIASKFCKVKLIYTEHSTTNRRRDIKFFKPIDKWVYNQYNTVICISDKTKENLQSYLCKTKAELVVINNGIDVQKYQEAQPLPKDSVNYNKVIVTMVAAFRYQKDHETVIKAFQHLDGNKFELWFVGDGLRRKEIETAINEFKISNYVRLLGKRNDIPSILKSSDIVIQSSHVEGFGLAAVEGMAAGKPVVATDIPGLAQVVKGAGILVPHKDYNSLAEEIKHLVVDSNYYHKIACQCYERAKMFDIHKMVKLYENVYQQLCK